MRNSKAFFTREKLKKTIERVSKYRYQNIKEFEQFLYKEDEKREITPQMPDDNNYEVGHVGLRWKGYNKYLWLKFQNVSFDKTDKEVVCVFDFGKHVPDGNNEGFEAEAYIDGKLYQAIDANHLELFLKPEHLEKPFDLTFRLWSGLTGGHGVQDVLHDVKTAFIANFDYGVDQFVYLGKTIWETIERLEMTNPNDTDAIYLLNLFNDAHLKIDFAAEFYDQQAFLNSIYNAKDYLLEELKKHNRKLNVTVHGVGHTHIDVAWLWQLKHTREKAQRSFSTVMRLMERFPEYKFMQTQAQIYYHLKKDNPGLYEGIKKLVKEKRWDVEGSMWVESDCNIPSGESLVRQVLYGKGFFKKEFDVDTKILWLPDVFGYSWALPQILKKAEIDTFMTTKISWNEYNRLPHDTFYWEGLDGSKILTHCITTPFQYQPTTSIYGGYNALVTPFTVEGVWRKYEDKEINNDVLMSYGFGDGGGGVTREMLELRRYIDMMPGLPHFKTTTASDYFVKLHDNINKTDKYVHTWKGELYFEYHRGTYSSQALVKKNNRKVEFLYRKAEALNALSKVLGQKEQMDLFEGWEKILTNQFHDIIPGSSITEVYEDAKHDYGKAFELGYASIDHVNKDMVLPVENYVHVYNDSTFERDDYIFYQSDKDLAFYKSDIKLESQKVENGYLIFVQNIKPLSYINVEVRESKDYQENTTFTYANQSIETPFYIIKLNQIGQIESLYDKEAERFVQTSNMNVLQIFDDLPNEYDAWNVDISYQDKMRFVDELVESKVVENNQLRFVLRQTWKYQKSTIVQDMILYKDDRRIDFVNHVDWHTQNQLLKVAFPVDVHTNVARYDIQFGNVERPNHWNTSWDLARFEVVGHKWADLSEPHYGVALMNESKYGYDIKDNVMRLTLLRGTKYPDPYADQGHHEFTYSLYPHMGNWLDADVDKEAWKLNNQLIFAQGKANMADKSLFKINSPYINIDAVKISEDQEGIIVRLHDYSGGKQNITIESDFEMVAYESVNLLEKPIAEKVKANSIKTTIKPYEILTFKVYFK